MLCPVRGSVTTLACVLLKDSNRAFVARLGPEIDFWACLRLVQGQTPHYQMLVIHPAFYLIFDTLPRGPQRQLGSYKLLNRAAPFELARDFISLYPTMSRGTDSPALCCKAIPFNTFWHCRTNGDVVLAAWRALKATWLSKQTLTSFFLSFFLSVGSR
jgi:hypothetical protein